MSTRNTSSIPALHVRIAVASDDILPADFPLLTLLPPRDCLIWNHDRAFFGWGRAYELSLPDLEDQPVAHFQRNESMSASARFWDLLCEQARVDWEGDLQPEDYPTLPAFPLAFASFSFAPGGGGTLIVPRFLLIDEAGVRFAVSTAPGTAEDPLEVLRRARADASPTTLPHPEDLHLSQGQISRDAWRTAVADITQRLKSHEAAKVVMARDISLSSPTPVDERALAERLHVLYPQTWVFTVDGLVGATPEMLARVHSGTVYSRVLAGTSTQGDGEALFHSLKDRTEHLFAVESVVRALSPLASSVQAPERPFILSLPNVSHLASDISAQLEGANVIDVVAALHPTAAVCGTPLKRAQALIAEHEHMSRGRYSGPVGWIDARGEGEFGIALRCGQLSADRTELRIFAGGGIMPDSDPDAEVRETEAKMRPLLDALGMPHDL